MRAARLLHLSHCSVQCTRQQLFAAVGGGVVLLLNLLALLLPALSGLESRCGGLLRLELLGGAPQEQAELNEVAA